jgi:hypothetical protein
MKGALEISLLNTKSKRQPRKRSRCSREYLYLNLRAALGSEAKMARSTLRTLFL